MRRREAGGAPGQRPGDHGTSAMLLRLREADVVRLCGLRAAAHGLDFVSRHAVTQPRRRGARLAATILPLGGAPDAAEPITPYETWCEATETTPAALTIRWGCACQPDAPSPGALGCAHVAALLTAWVRAPSAFRASADPTTPTDVSNPPDPNEPAPTTQTVVQRILTPRTDGAPPIARPPGWLTLADELRRMHGADALALARRLLGALSAASSRPPPTLEIGTVIASARPQITDGGASPEPTAARLAEPTVALDAVPSMTEDEARDQAAAILSDPQRAPLVVARLDPDAQSLINDILLIGGAITSADLAALTERAGRAASASQQAMGVLERFGLIFRVVSAAPAPMRDRRPAWGRVTGWRMAPETRAALVVRLGAATDEAALRRTSPQRGAMRTRRASARPLALALALLARAPGPLGPFDASPLEQRTPQPGQAHTGAATLTPGDLPPGRLVELARGAGLAPELIRMARRVLLWAREQAPGQPLTDLASAPVSERALALRAGFRLWRDADSAADLVDLESAESPVRMRYDLRSPAFRPAALAAEAAEARRFVVALLTHAQPGAWYTVADLLDLVWRVNPLFLRGRQQAYTIPAWRLERAADGRPLRPTVRDEWLAGEGAYLRALLRGPLHWWGALDLRETAPASPASPTKEPMASAVSPSQPTLHTPTQAPQVIAFRLTDLGAYLLAEAEGRGAERGALTGDWGAPLLMSREGALAAHPLAASARQLNALGAWAQPTGVVGGRLIYTLSANLACAAYDRGLTPTDAVSAIQATGRVADRLLAQLEAWRSVYGSTRIGVGWALLEARDAMALREALAYAPAIAARARLLSPTIALVHPADLETLRTTLARKGYVV